MPTVTKSGKNLSIPEIAAAAVLSSMALVLAFLAFRGLPLSAGPEMARQNAAGAQTVLLFRIMGETRVNPLDPYPRLSNFAPHLPPAIDGSGLCVAAGMMIPAFSDKDCSKPVHGDDSGIVCVGKDPVPAPATCPPALFKVKARASAGLGPVSRP